MKDLENQAENSTDKGSKAEARIDALLQAFELFCQETSRLEGAYSSLKQEFQSANVELEQANETLSLKVHELHELTGYLKNILTHISQGLIFIDLKGIITLFNPAAAVIFSVSREHVISKPFSDCFPDNFFGFSLSEALKNHKAPSFTRLSFPSGPKKKDKQLEIESDFVLTPSEVNGLIITVRDVTENKRLELLANRNDRMKELGILAAEVAHEIRNPLGGIKGFASLLKRDLKGQPELEKMAGYIVEGTDDLNELVTQVLDYSRPVEPHFAIVKLKPLIEEVINFIRLDNSLNPKPEFVIDLHPDSLEASLDAHMTRGALLNLAVNAVQAMPDGGVLTFKGKIENNDLILEICDTGPGVPAEYREKIFSPFFTTKTQGNGFGLAEVLKVILAQGGQIDLETDECPGAHFKITLPQKV